MIKKYLGHIFYAVSIFLFIPFIFNVSIFGVGELSVIEGYDDDAAITINFKNSEVTLYTRGNSEPLEVSDLNVKHFKSGGFVIKNPELGILVFGHPQGEQYKLFVLTGDRNVYRIIADITTMDTLTITPKETVTPKEPTETIEPKSSVGSDITNWDVPATASRDVEREPSLDVLFQNPTSIFVNTEYSPQIQTINEMSEGVEVSGNLKIQRDGVVLTDIDGMSTSQGIWNPGINISYPKFYPGFCYDVIVTVNATSGNMTDTTTHDFLAITSQKYFDGSGEYRILPEKIRSDGDCNK